MKSTDIALIILIAMVATIASYFIGNSILGDPNDKVEQITYVQTISGDVLEPSVEILNKYFINPTPEVYVGRCNVGQVYDALTGKCYDFEDPTGKDPEKPEPEPEPNPNPNPNPDED